jgi:hypothetical protein
MGSAMRSAHRLRLAALLALGAFALHQLRYLIASPAELVEHSHGYLTGLLPGIAVLVLAAALATLIRGTEGASSERAPLVPRIALFSSALLTVYFGQESLEGLLGPAHAPGLAAGLVHGGWIALPLAIVIGGLAAIIARALEAVERAIAVVHVESRLRRRPPAVRGRALAAPGMQLASTPLAFGLARRPPPQVPA